MYEPVSVVLPSRMFHEIHARKLQGQCLKNLKISLREWWEMERKSDEGLFYVQQLQAAYGRVDDDVYPMLFHEDGVPCYHSETVQVWSWSCPLCHADSWISRNAIVALPSSRVARATRAALLDVLRWDLDQLAKGEFSLLDHMGRPQTKNHGVIMNGFKACFSWWKGDMEAHYISHNLQRYYKANLICDHCRAMTNNVGLSWGNFHAGALWRGTLDPLGCQEGSPWTAVTGYSKHRRLFDSTSACNFEFLNLAVALSYALAAPWHLAIDSGVCAGGDPSKRRPGHYILNLQGLSVRT